MRKGMLRTYVMLRPVEGALSGFARLEVTGSRVQLTARVTPAEAPLRALLLGGRMPDAAVEDLGRMHPGGQQASLHHGGLPAARLGTPEGYHTLVIATDWPDARLLLMGSLAGRPCCTPQEARQAVAAYLALPPEGSVPLPEASSPDEEASCEACPAAEADRPHGAAPPVQLSPLSAEPPPACLMALQPVRWPQALRPLEEEFARQPPAAPFDAPGWRFIRLSLPPDAPARFCYVGRLVRGGRVAEVVYALPGERATLPPGGLQGYRYVQGRHGAGYWAAHQPLDNSPQ